METQDIGTDELKKFFQQAKEMTHNLDVNFEEMTPFVQRKDREGALESRRESSGHADGAVENAEVAETECVQTMTTAEINVKSDLFNLRHRIQFMQVDFEHVDECKPHSKNLAKWKRGAQGTSGNTRTPLLMSRRKTLKHQAEQTAKYSIHQKHSNI